MKDLLRTAPRVMTRLVNISMMWTRLIAIRDRKQLQAKISNHKLIVKKGMNPTLEICFNFVLN
jgi:hypothetical protein